MKFVLEITNVRIVHKLDTKDVRPAAEVLPDAAALRSDELTTPVFQAG